MPLGDNAQVPKSLNHGNCRDFPVPLESEDVIKRRVTGNLRVQRIRRNEQARGEILRLLLNVARAPRWAATVQQQVTKLMCEIESESLGRAPGIQEDERPLRAPERERVHLAILHRQGEHAHAFPFKEGQETLDRRLARCPHRPDGGGSNNGV